MAQQEKKGFWKEFKEFISRGNVLDMAVGIIIGGAFTAIITALVNNILTPLLQMIPGMGDDGFGALQVVLKEAVIQDGVTVSEAVVMDFGIVISAIITFLLTALVLFLIVRTVNRVRERAEEYKAAQESAKAAETEQHAEETAPAAEEQPAEEQPAEEAVPAAEEQPAEEAAPAPTVEELLAEIRDLLKNK